MKLSKNLNLTISINRDILYDNNLDKVLIINLERTKKEKRRVLDNSYKMNQQFKSQLESNKDKLSFGDI